MEGSFKAVKVTSILTGNSAHEWGTKKQIIMDRWLNIVNEKWSICSPDYSVLSKTEEEGYVCKRIEYTAPDGDTVPALLLLPHYEGEKLPGILALHPTDEKGKMDIAHRSGRKERSYGIELAKRGYAVLAPDTITAGDRVGKGERPFETKGFYERYPSRTAAGKMMADHLQGIEVLASMQETDQNRIGVIGHSLGGYNAYFLATVEKRIKAIVCSCGFSMMAGDPERHRWGKRDWFSHFPVISDWIDNGEIPFDFHEILSLCAPVPLFLWMCRNDPVFPHWKEALNGILEVQKVYDGLAEKDSFDWMIGSSGHEFPSAIREHSYQFLDRYLKFTTR
ncbi:dipeptidyl aminopeptidase [Bacillus sp. FJAT-42376]|uniref:dienelactone hydrolase family protein n=1 Tax=Bacillus sp. FJAT-42376 TaxID=2014076 RepID=UPI000F4F8061|nr:acetylxylan esterase [Bacillus sp. FJAT-42376]AZB43758.1 dipeptidyl aminopeptidase [Bacillus sp. FJAT-42376]